MNVKDLKLNIHTAAAAAAVLVAASGAWYTLRAKVAANEDQIMRVEIRNIADSNRIRRIENRGAVAKVERDGIREQIRELQEQMGDNGRKLDTILRELQR